MGSELGHIKITVCLEFKEVLLLRETGLGLRTQATEVASKMGDSQETMAPLLSLHHLTLAESTGQYLSTSL